MCSAIHRSLCARVALIRELSTCFARVKPSSPWAEFRSKRYYAHGCSATAHDFWVNVTRSGYNLNAAQPQRSVAAQKGKTVSQKSDPMNEPPLDAPDTGSTPGSPNSPTNPDQLVGPDGPDGPREESTEKSSEGSVGGSAVPAPSASTGPDGPAPSEDGGAAGEAAAAIAPDRDGDAEDEQDNRDNEANVDDIDPADNPSNPDLVGHDVAEEDPARAEPTA